jgi:tetratricopeptide (TPR) repeat protein
MCLASLYLWNIGLGYLAKGEFKLAIDSLMTAVQIAKDPFYAITAKHFLGICYILSAQFDKAEDVIQEAITYSQKYGCELFGNMNIGFQGVLMILEGHMSKGLSQIVETLQTFKDKECKATCGIFEYLLGKTYSQIATGAKPAFSIMVKNIGFLAKNVPLAKKRAEEHLKQTIEISKEIGMKGFLGMSYLDLGLLYETSKKPEEARNLILRSIEVFEECEADGFLKQAKKALRNLGRA